MNIEQPNFGATIEPLDVCVKRAGGVEPRNTPRKLHSHLATTCEGNEVVKKRVEKFFLIRWKKILI